MLLRGVAGLAAALLLSQAAAAQPAHSGFPVDIAVAKAPAPVTADGRTRLLYELRITNFYTGAVELERLEVRAPDGRALETLSRLVMTQLELRRRSIELDRARAERESILVDLRRARAELSVARRGLASSQDQLLRKNRAASRKPHPKG